MDQPAGWLLKISNLLISWEEGEIYAWYISIHHIIFSIFVHCTHLLATTRRWSWRPPSSRIEAEATIIFWPPSYSFFSSRTLVIRTLEETLWWKGVFCTLRNTWIEYLCNETKQKRPLTPTISVLILVPTYYYDIFTTIFVCMNGTGFLSVVTGRPIPPKYFENIFKTNDSVGVTRQQTWLRNEKIADYFGENLDILTDLIWIFNNSNWIHNIFSKYFGGIGLLVTTDYNQHCF